MTTRRYARAQGSSFPVRMDLQRRRSRCSLARDPLQTGFFRCWLQLCCVSTCGIGPVNLGDEQGNPDAIEASRYDRVLGSSEEWLKGARLMTSARVNKPVSVSASECALDRLHVGHCVTSKENFEF